MSEANHEKPEHCTDEHLDYLDKLQESGETNMYGSVAYLMRDNWDIPTERDGQRILYYWMQLDRDSAEI